MTSEKLVIWHLISDDGWVEGTAESNIPVSAIATLNAKFENTGQTGRISTETYKEYHVVNNGVLKAAYTRFGIFPN
jgi:hypothetical protein